MRTMCASAYIIKATIPSAGITEKNTDMLDSIRKLVGVFGLDATNGS